MIKNEKEIAAHARQLNKLESEADVIYRGAISELFDGTHEIIDIIRWKEQEAWKILPTRRKMGNLVKEVVMKYA